MPGMRDVYDRLYLWVGNLELPQGWIRGAISVRMIGQGKPRAPRVGGHNDLSSSYDARGASSTNQDFSRNYEKAQRKVLDYAK
jgi:hypothetical protein